MSEVAPVDMQREIQAKADTLRLIDIEFLETVQPYLGAEDLEDNDALLTVYNTIRRKYGFEHPETSRNLVLFIKNNFGRQEVTE